MAAAASRAWNEIIAQPAWTTNWMVVHRDRFDGAREVADIVDTAMQIMSGRETLGRPAAGVAGSYWHRQHAELDAAAGRLGTRADSLIRCRDHVAELSRAVHHLEELQRMERSALAVDQIVIATSFGYADHERRMADLADEIAAARMGIEDLLGQLTQGAAER